jgi:carbon monoxide dehydrogenase subunit G
MELTGTHTFPAPQAVVWRVLTDPQTLRRTLPGCQAFEPRPDGSYHVVMSIGIASIRGTYTGSVELLDELPPDSYTLKVAARGGVGFVDGTGHFALAPAPGDAARTLVSYAGHAQAGGKIAGVGQRLLKAGADLIAGQFFKALEKELPH